MKYTWKTFVIFAGILTIIACGEPPEIPKPPIEGTLEYRIGRTLDEQPTHIRVTSIAGKRCYNNEKGTGQTHYFLFDDDRDTVKVDITDVFGVTPGQSYVHRLYFKNSDGTIKDDASFVFELKNPFSAAEPKFVFSFELVVDGAEGRSIPKGTELGGIYEFSESDRNMAVDLEFLLETDIPYTSVCSDYD